ncbi:hypothetical protein D3C78_1000300 [compost metagenome]
MDMLDAMALREEYSFVSDHKEKMAFSTRLGSGYGCTGGLRRTNGSNDENRGLTSG